MRQLGQSEDDDKLRMALENMRYKACTDDDIAYLKTRVAGRSPTAPKLASKEFRNVPVITAHNLQKDHINLLGSDRFANENGQKITSFYSVDRYRAGTADLTTKAARTKNRKVIDYSRQSDRIPDDQQEAIWALEPKYTCHKPGRLDLCIGMLVMLRYNEATECCMTNGANAVVVGWQADADVDRPSLDTLFVKLVNPPRDVHLEGLPLNVVPLVKRSDRIEVVLKNGNKIRLTRLQIPALLNFAVTDYGAQGQTREKNPVDLRNCGSCRGMYVALSRSSTSDGLIIVSDFAGNAHLIQGGLERFVRQEYRELELLNEITRLKYEGKLPVHIHAHRRNTLIRLYQAWIGLGIAPKGIHRSITWSPDAPMSALEPTKDDKWIILTESTKSKPSDGELSQRQAFVNRVCVPALGSSAVVINDAVKRGPINSEDSRPAKKLKSQLSVDDHYPPGFVQDNQNYSCAYDALFNVFQVVWVDRKAVWSKAFRSLNPFMSKLDEGLRQCDRGTISLITVRNRVRKLLHSLDAQTFPYGALECSINNLALALTTSPTLNQTSTETCDKCKTNIEKTDQAAYFVDCDPVNAQGTDACVTQHFNSVLQARCGVCNEQLRQQLKYEMTPDVLVLALSSHDVSLSQTVRMMHITRMKSLHLCGIVYFCDNHFTARVIQLSGCVLFYDGHNTNGVPENDGHIDDFNDTDWRTRSSAAAVMAVYCK
ncbi:hypothetical protein FIBSPDRAFT_750019 [Athelia psychrophila]|uniref:Uncharacterized protein n=1 Tax=Athelia psychrophila TaxID=1759441 RepID=A0A166EAP1_9AGAM|nr:hypothetical protein FIBSPDRAFT_750019 [Fibularhizoctonia sp. CBS 109695]